MKIHIIVGSTRQNRVSAGVAEWAKTSVETAGHEAIMVDLRDHELPFVDALPSTLNKVYAYESVNAWSKVINDAEAFIFVTPEYNHGFSGVLKNAIDWLWSEWAGKPASVLSYSVGFTAGARGAEQLKLVLNSVGIILSGKHIALPNIRSTDGSDIDPRASEQMGGVLTALENLKKVA